MPISDDLKELSLISGPKVCAVFDDLYSDILTVAYTSEHLFMSEMWNRFTPSNPSLNGAVFEGILAVVFYRSGILPLYVQAKFEFVPNVDFDFVAYSREFGPIILSAKTSLRERYKQADLEGMMLRQVHRRAKSYLITLNEAEAAGVNRKIYDGKVLGLDEVIIATQPAFSERITYLKTLTYYKPEKIDVVTSTRLIE